MTQWIGWLQLAAEQAVLALALLVVAWGGWRLARDGISRRIALAVAAALVLPVGDAWLNMNLVKSVRDLQARKLVAIAEHGREPAGGWDKAASSPEERAKLSAEAATVSYVFQGERTDVVDAGGARTRFVPTPEQERAREQFVRNEKGAEVAAQAGWERGIRLLLETATVLVAGIVLGRRQRGRPRVRALAA